MEKLRLWYPLGPSSTRQQKPDPQRTRDPLAGPTFGESSRAQMFDLPAKARQWREDYERLLAGCEGDCRFLASDFEEEVDEVMVSALWLACHQEIISAQEYSELGSLIWEQVGIFRQMATAKWLAGPNLHHYIYGAP